MRRSHTLEVEAPAKVNLSLEVLGRRPDGYHEIDSVIAPISLADRLEVHAHADPTQFRTLSISLAVRGDPELVRPVPADESNLVIVAAHALAERTGSRGFADFVLEKRIPTAAGLAGGSSDAAAALRALNDLWGCGLDATALADVAATVGSDVPAMLHGGPVRVSGRGERVEPAVRVELSLILVPFDFGIRTADAYRWWDEDGGSRAPNGPHPNDLEEPVLRRHPQIGEVRDLLVQLGAPGAFVCGSGPTVAGILPGNGLGPGAEAQLQAISGRPTLRVRTGSG